MAWQRERDRGREREGEGARGREREGEGGRGREGEMASCVFACLGAGSTDCVRMLPLNLHVSHPALVHQTLQ